MKTSLRSFLSLAGLVLAFALAGCAGIDASNQRSLLSAAGFRARTPETAKQRELYATAPSYKLQKVTLNGKTFYAYKDEKNGVAYVGSETEYQQYQKLALQQQIADRNLAAAEMNRDMAMGWYGAYGPYVYGPARIAPPPPRRPPGPPRRF